MTQETQIHMAKNLNEQSAAHGGDAKECQGFKAPLVQGYEAR